MLHSQRSARDKRVELRRLLSGATAAQFPGAFNALSARLIEQHGFPGVYISGAVLSANQGLPDIGLTTSTEVAHESQQISRMIDLPTIVDADTGFGEPLNVARTVQILEDAGVSALHIEDQVNPKRCGHLDGKSVVSEEFATQRIRAAVGARRDDQLVVIARTDIRAVNGFPAAVERARALVDAGADVIFPEALISLEEFELMAQSVGVPILANMTEFGKSELFSHQELSDAGVKLIIYPVSLLRLAMGAAERGLHTLATEGSLNSVVPSMHTRSNLYELIDYSAYTDFDSRVYTGHPPTEEQKGSDK